MPEAPPNINGELMLKVEILFSILKSDGFQLTTDHYADMLFVTGYLKPRNLGEIAHKLCPIVATSEREQTRFHEIIQQLDPVTVEEITEFVTTGGKPAPDDDRISARSDRWVLKKVALWAAPITVLLMVILIFSWPKLFPPPEIVIFPNGGVQPGNSVNKGDTLKLDATAWLPNGTDTSKIDFSWDFGQSKILHGLHASHVYTKPGDSTIKMTARSGYYRIKNANGLYGVHVCNHITKISGLRLSSPLTTNDSVKISVVSDSTSIRYDWIIDDSIRFSTLNAKTGYVFKQEGYHSIDVTAIAGGVNNCNSSQSTTVEVLDKTRSYTVRVTGYNKLPQLSMRVKQWVPVLVWALALLCSAMLFLSVRKQIKTIFRPGGNVSRKAVFEVPFLVNDLAIIRPGKKFFKAMHLMRRRADEEVSQLDISLTLTKTIRNKGLADLVFTPRRKFQEYLLLIDMANPKGAFRHVFGFISRLMFKMDVRVCVYYVDKQFYFQGAGSVARITPQQLANNHPNALPIWLGDGSNLLYSLLPFIKDKYLRFFIFWESRVIITPLPRKEWGQREKILAKDFLISSADEDDLLRLIEKIHLVPEQQAERKAQFSATPPKIDFRNIEDAFEYLANDEQMTQWLCAIAVYPRFRWELLPAFGAVLAKLYAPSEGVSYEDILKLARVSWLREGSIPPPIRLELLKKLQLVNEIAVRAELIKMLELAKLSGNGFYYDSEIEDQLTINKFILYVHDPKNNVQYAAEADKFKVLWQNGQVPDAAVRLYLENADGEKWQTPLQAEGRPLSLEKYFAKPAKKSAWSVYHKVAAASLIFMAAFGFNWYSSAIGPGQNTFTGIFYEAASDQLVDIKYKLVKHTRLCNNADSSFVSDLTGSFNIGGKQYPVNYHAADNTIEAKVPYDAIAQKTPGITLTMDSGNPSYVENDVPFKPLYTNGTIVFSCKKADSIDHPLLVSLPPALNEIWQGGTSNRLISIDIPHHVIYYSVGDVNTYGSYTIDEVDTIKSNAGNVYKVITKTKEGYKLFFMKNLKPGAFDLSVCQNFVISKAILQNKDTSYCDHSNTMHWYYQNDKTKIFYPVADGSLVRSEVSKLTALPRNYFYVVVNGKEQKVQPQVQQEVLSRNYVYTLTHYTGWRNDTRNLSSPLLATEGIHFVARSITVDKISPFYRSYDLIGIKPDTGNSTVPITPAASSVASPNRILWVDDNPSGNQPEIDYFRKNNIPVDLVLTNNDAYKKLNITAYSFIITNIARVRPEPCVTNKYQAGIEFIEQVNFPKQFILINSPHDTTYKYRDVLSKLGFSNSWNSTKEIIKATIVGHVGNGSNKPLPQQECATAVKSSRVYTTGSRISASDAKKILDHHNMARKEVGVPPLVWSKELAAFAQKWADHLASTKTFSHRPNNKNGENIFMGSGSYTPLDASLSWYGEVKDYKYGKFTGAGGVGHYTQMIWKNTTQIGVGVAISANGDIYVVANYSPAGNYIGEFPY